MMGNPVEDFLSDKHAGIWSGIAAGGREAGGALPEQLGRSLVNAGSFAAVAAGITGVTMAAGKLYQAATKRRDFRAMMAFNPDLQEHHQADPATFNQLYSSLRNVNTEFSADPVIAGSYMRRMVGSPMAGGVLTDALGFRKDQNQGMSTSFRDAGIAGGQKGLEFKKPKPKEK